MLQSSLHPCCSDSSLNVWLTGRTNVTSWSRLQVGFSALGPCRASLHSLGRAGRLLTRFPNGLWAASGQGLPVCGISTWSRVCCSWTERGSWKVWATGLGVPFICFHQTFSVNVPTPSDYQDPAELTAQAAIPSGAFSPFVNTGLSRAIWIFQSGICKNETKRN